MIATVAPSGMVAISCNERTLRRRQQRQHTLACLKAGAMQRAHHKQETLLHNQLVSSDETLALITSLAIHRADNSSFQWEFHYAGTANVAARAASHKSNSTFKRHRVAHQNANAVKHCNGEVDRNASERLPPSAPPVLDLTGAISYHELEHQLKSNLSQTSSHGLNPNAAIFVPFSGGSCK